MEDWRLEKDRSFDVSDLGFSAQPDIKPVESRTGLRARDDFEEDERRLHDKRRSSLGWTVPARETSEIFLRRNTLLLGIDDIEEQGLLKEINTRDRALLDKACCSEDVIRVWNHISFFIINKLKEGNGVQIPGLYTITYQIEKTIMRGDTEYFVLKKIPVMIMSKFLIETYNLHNKFEDEFVFRVSFAKILACYWFLNDIFHLSYTVHV